MPYKGRSFSAALPSFLLHLFATCTHPTVLRAGCLQFHSSRDWSESQTSGTCGSPHYRSMYYSLPGACRPGASIYYGAILTLSSLLYIDPSSSLLFTLLPRTRSFVCIHPAVLISRFQYAPLTLVCVRHASLPHVHLQWSRSIVVSRLLDPDPFAQPRSHLASVALALHLSSP